VAKFFLVAALKHFKALGLHQERRSVIDVGELVVFEWWVADAMNRSKRSKFAWMLATAALPVTTAVFTGNANAACAPAAPVNNTTVTCTGATNNQNAPDGYGTGNENGLTINVESGASVTGTRAGVGVGAVDTSNTINNLGAISGRDHGIRFGGTATVNNSGTIASSGNRGIEGTAVTFTNRASGVVSAHIGMSVANATVTNFGSITGTGGDGIQLVTGTIDNFGSGKISTLGVDRTAISGSNFSVTNLGLITAAGVNAVGIESDGPSGSVTVTNFGFLIAGKFGINAATANVTNADKIESTAADGAAINAATATVTNSRTIRATGFGSFGVQATDNLVVNNSAGGTIEATGVNAIALQATNTADVTNFGTIRSTNANGIAINAASALINNKAGGTISGTIGILASGLNNAGTVITNAGTIAGTGGTAIRLSPAADTLTLLPGSKINGVVDMGGGADTVNIVGNTVTITSRVSSVFKVAPVEIPVLLNFTGTLNTNTVNNPNSMPFVQAAGTIATLDPTAFGQADRTLMNFTGGISSLVQGRLGGSAASGSAVQVVSFSPAGGGRANEAFAAMPAKSSTLGYAKEPSKPLTHTFTYADAPYNVWTSGFAGTSMQKGDDIMLRSVASAGAAVIGVDRQVRPDLLVGAFAGGGTGRLSVELNSQSVDTDYVTGGVYGRFDWISHFLDFTLQGGATANKSQRQVLNESAPGGSETATASYDSWYISPEIAYGRRYHFANGYTLTPMGRIRYLAGTFDGYNETGSAQNLVVGRRTLHDLEERAEVELSKITGVGAGSFRTSVHGGLIALQRLGNPTINTVLIGQDLSFTTPGKASTAGVVAGVGFDLRATDRMSLFGAFEATLMSDQSRTAAGKAGLKVAF
jgi:hypothetical protein